MSACSTSPGYHPVTLPQSGARPKADLCASGAKKRSGATMCTCESERDRQRCGSYLDAHAHGKGLDGRTHIKVGATATRHHVISRTLTLFDAWRQISPCLSQYCPKRSPWRALTFVGAGLRFLRPLVRPSTRHNRGGRTSPNGAALESWRKRQIKKIGRRHNCEVGKKETAMRLYVHSCLPLPAHYKYILP